MALTQLFFKKENAIATIKLDVIIKESATATAKLTENPVESGANMNDHIIIEPMTFTVEGVVSNISSSFIGQFSQLVDTFTQDNSNAQEAWEALLQLQIDREPFTLVQGLRSYDNIVILTLNEQQDKETSNGLFFNATMKEVIFVGAEATTLSQFNEPDIADQVLPTIIGGLKNLAGL